MEEEKKVKLRIGLGVVAIAVVLIGGYFYFSTHYLSSNSFDAERVAAIATEQNNFSLCGKMIMPVRAFNINDINSLRDECDRQVAKNLKDYTICDYITDGDSGFYKGNCIADIAVLTNNIEACKVITNQISAGSCYKYFAEMGASSSICEKISDSDKLMSSGKDLCYMGIAKYSSDVSVCDINIKQSDYKNQCYTLVAEQTNNSSICDKINGQYSDFEKKDCLRYTNK